VDPEESTRLMKGLQETKALSRNVRPRSHAVKMLLLCSPTLVPPSHGLFD
jgi:hypothetical protein